MVNPENLDWNDSGLIPAVVQDAATGQVLTLAYVSRESLTRMRELGETVFYSRSRQTLWHKGETSGNFQTVVAVAADCDRDAILIQVKPQGPACHTGAASCFGDSIEGFPSTNQEQIGSILGELERTIGDRKAERPAGSYTTKLFDRGTERIFQKIGEEAVETVVAGVSGNRDELVREASDLLYHLLVGLSQADIPLSEVARELRSRRK